MIHVLFRNPAHSRGVPRALEERMNGSRRLLPRGLGATLIVASALVVGAGGGPALGDEGGEIIQPVDFTHNVLDPLFKKKALKRGPTKFDPDWDANNASTIFSQMLVKTNNNIQGVIAANDNIAGAVVADEKAHHLKPIPLSGQDTTAQGVQYILAGWQSGTVYKYVPLEANAVAAAAVALLHGKKPHTNGFRLNGKKKEPTLVIPVQWITKKNYKQLFAQHWLSRSQVCIGVYKKYCT